MTVVGPKPEALSVYVPKDRCHAMAQGSDLPDIAYGAALFADTSGFTALTEALALELGPQRGIEELTRHLNAVYDALIAELHRYRGSVVGFSGDAITCWFPPPAPPKKGEREEAEWTKEEGLRLATLRAAACALAMQRAMAPFASVAEVEARPYVPGGRRLSLGIKTAIASGPARRFLVGDPDSRLIDALAGATLDSLAATEHHANRGEVLLHQSAAAILGDRACVQAWRQGARPDERFALIDGLAEDVAPEPWPPLADNALTEEQIRPWLLPPVYERLHSGQGEFLAELRPAVALFLHFRGIDYDHDRMAGRKLDRFIRQVQQILDRYEAFVIQLTFGDKGSYLYAPFGAPLAHEDDAIRATSAALELHAIAASLPYINGIQIGITLGRMRTGAYGSATRRTYGVLGDATNLAARLMQAASPGQTLVNETVYAATQQDFDWEALPAIRVKGKAEPVRVYSLRGRRQRRTTRLHESQYTLPLVGRGAELELIRSELDEVSRGRGQVIGITAEAGMDKSRLMAEIIHLVAQRDWPIYGGECQSFGTNSGYHAWHGIWSDFFELDPAWSAQRQIETLRSQLAAIDPSLALASRLPLLSAVLPQLSMPDNELTAAFDGKLRKTSLEALLIDCLRARAAQRPLVLMLENCHWLDPLSYDLVHVVGQAIADLPVLLVVAYRPPQLQYLQAPRVSALVNYAPVELRDFSPNEAGDLIRLKLQQMFGAGVQMAGGLAEGITARSGGNPFYIEEILNYLQSQQIDPDLAGNGKLLEQLDLPTSLHSLILSRIDQFSERQKVTLKVASVIGRHFKADDLCGYYPPLDDPEQIRSDLQALERADVILLEEPEPNLSYLFKHVITLEVAYESLPYATRAVLHERLAEYIEAGAGERLDQVLDQLAFHYGHSENVAKKRTYLLEAGQRAQEAYNNSAAIDYFQQVLPLFSGSERVEIMLRLAQVLDLVGRWADAAERLREALDLAEELGDRQCLAHCQMALGEHQRKRGRYKEAKDWLEQARATSQALGDQASVAQVLHYEGTLTAQQGDYEQARALFQQSLDIRRRLNDRPNIASLSSNLGNVARLMGQYDLARSLHEEGLAIRQALGDRWAIAVSLNNLGNVARNQGRLAEAHTLLEQAVALQREVGDRAMLVNALNDLGNVARDQQELATAQALYSEALQINRSLGNKWALAHLLEDAGSLAALQQKPERALRLAGAASALRDEIGAPLSTTEQARLDSHLAGARQQLGPASRETESAGRALTLQAAVEEALQA